MNEFEDRLRAADPAAAQSYQHPDPDAMISRIMARAPRAHRHVLRSFQLRMAGSVALAAALTVGGIAALDAAAPSLSVFALCPRVPTPAPVGRRKHSPSAHRRRRRSCRCESWRSSISRPVRTSVPAPAAPRPTNCNSPPVRRPKPRESPRSSAVSGTPVDSNGDGRDFTVTDPSGELRGLPDLRHGPPVDVLGGATPGGLVVDLGRNDGGYAQLSRPSKATCRPTSGDSATASRSPIRSSRRRTTS